MRFAIINAPKRSGKSTLAEMVKAAIPLHRDVAIIGFAHHLKRFVHGIYLGAEGFALPPDDFESVKEEPQAVLGGMSWRQAYIHYSERVVKPLHGKRWFGEQMLRAAKADGADFVIVPDGWFREEAEVVVEHAGAKNVLLVRLSREGYRFDETDSRGHVDLSDLGVETMLVANREGDMAGLRRKAAFVAAWLRTERADAA